MGVGLLLIVVFYGIYQTRFVLWGPSLFVESPTDGEVFTEPLITISGRVGSVAYISVNDYQIFSNEEGFFTHTLLLPEGHSIIKVMVRDRFGNTETREVNVVFEESPGTENSVRTETVSTSTEETL